MTPVGENVRYLLWLHDRDFEGRQTTRDQCSDREERWVHVLAKWLGGNDRSRARHLLQYEDYTAVEIARVADANGIAEGSGDISHERMVDRLPQGLFYMNINFLLDNLERGGKIRLCETLGVDASTVSRWRTGTMPSKDRRDALGRFFGLTGDEIESGSVFLSTEPVGIVARKEYLKRKIDEMRPEDLQRHYASLRVLMEQR